MVGGSHLMDVNDTNPNHQIPPKNNTKNPVQLLQYFVDTNKTSCGC